MNLLGRALGACLSKTDNLRAVYLPVGVPPEIAVSIVREANRLKPAEPPFAILVSAEGEETSDGCVRVSSENVIKYRQGDRLIVASGRHTDFNSISTSFAEVFGLSYPQPATGLVTLERVAEASIGLVLESSAAGSDDSFDKQLAVGRLASCLKQLRDIHVEMRRGDLAWNAQWFTHVAHGIDRLANVLAEKAIADPALLLDDAFEKYTFASFSLPKPGAHFLIKPSGVGRAVVGAIDEWWSDQTTVQATAKHLRHHPDTDAAQHPMEGLAWGDFDADVVTAGNPLVALLALQQPLGEVVEAFSRLTANQFLNPTNRLGDKTELVVRGLHFEDLSVSSVAAAGPYLLETSLISADLIQSREIRIQIPTLTTPTREEGAGSRLSMALTPAQFKWSGGLDVDEDGTLWAVGSITRQIKGKKVKPVAPATVSLSFAGNDSLGHLVSKGAACVIYLLPPAGVGVVVFRVGGKGLLRKATTLGPETMAEILDDAGERFGEVFPMTFDDENSSYRVVAWAADDVPPAVHGGRPMDLLKGRSNVFVSAIRPTGLDIIELAGERFEFRAPQTRNSIQSPIVAAINNQKVSGEKPSSKTIDSVRGVLEDAYARNLGSADWLHANGHIVVLGEHDEIPLGEFVGSSDDGAFLMHPSTRSAWGSLTDAEVPIDLLESDEAVAFREAFGRLGVPHSLKREGAGSAGFPDWVSRTSWRHLWLEHREKLDDYLFAYRQLVAKARTTESAVGIFWAAYPFSVSVWGTRNSLECSAVLLSPLHPLRLAWLASVEGTLWEADAPQGLAGAVEGWNFPLLGPRHTKAGRMVAIPMDSGEEQIFLGWSMLVGASVDGEKPLTAPSRIGRLQAPGTAASGLNATAATSALRSYRKMHPHVSTLTVDLAAATETSRLEEVDQAVLAQLESWASENSGVFRGGARVLDSLCREGAMPSSQVAALAKKNLGMPLLWSRYVPDVQETQSCNIRLLQDSGVHLEVGSSSSSNRGVIAEVPLRRFEAGSAPGIKSNTAHSRPALQEAKSSWTAFADALNEIEGANSKPQVSSKLHRSALVDDRADWTVSGESLLSPAAMAALVKNQGAGSQMLWEWRPPFLEPAVDVPALERRPFVSVARVPFGFKSRLKEMLEKVTGEPIGDDAVGDLLGTLGARGVGLSSLLAMGGTHAAGALGFYLAFALAEFTDGVAGAEHFALPIDACDTFLKALAGDKSGGEKTQRADMLILTITDHALTLVPIEIKFYGLDSANGGGHLPGPFEASLKEALGQLESTTALLHRVEARGTALKNDGCEYDRALWNNALTTLVEAGIRLKPAGSKISAALTERLQGIADGTTPLQVGSPIVAYFKHDVNTHDGREFATHIGVSGLGENKIEFGALVANSRSAFESLDDPSGALVTEWKELVAWAMAPTSRSGGEAGTIPEPESKWPTPQEQAAQENSSVDVAGPAQPVASGDGIRFPVGNLIGSVGGAQAQFWPSNTALNQMNIGVVGDLGTGKTQLLKSLVFQLRAEAQKNQNNPLSFLIFDYKRDFQDEEFLSAVGGRVLHPQGIPLNIFALAEGYSPLAAFQKASSFCDIISKIYSGVGPVQRDRLITTITDLYKEAAGEAPTLAEVKERYATTGKADSVTSILNTFVLGEIFSANRAELVAFDQLIEDQVLIIALSDLGVDQNAKNSLVALFLNFYYDYMRRSQKWPYVGSDPQLRKLNSFLLVDEAVNIMGYSFDVLMDLMLQGREFGFGTILASQFLSHFKAGSGPNYGEPLLTWFIHKVPNVTSKQLSQLGVPGSTDEAAKKISKQKVHEAYYSSLGYPGRFIFGTPFYRLER